jgi:glutamate--cysteine ligase
MQNIQNTSSSPSSLETICLTKQHEIEHWFRSKWTTNLSPFYGSVDLRNNDFKLTPIDMNLFPGGFNNIDPQAIPLASQSINNLINRYCNNARSVLLIPENHTRNQAYLKNIYTLQYILEQAGIETKIGSLSPEITEPTEIDVVGQKHLIYHPIIRDGNQIKTTDGFTPCTILLNNDLSNGCPEILTGISQTVIPPLNAGWYMRKKTNFFTEYNLICEEFGRLVDIDPWRINAYFDVVTNLDFTNRIGFEILADKVDLILDKIKQKYFQYNIQEEPYVVVKANNGTYGMGIMTASCRDDIINMNRKTRNKMAVIKDGTSVTDVIVQEGVYTNETIQHKTAEPVIYMMNSSVIGGFYRVHPDKKNNQNLNAVGATFAPLTFTTNCLKRDKTSAKSSCPPNRFYAYGVIARLALLASSQELYKYK